MKPPKAVMDLEPMAMPIRGKRKSRRDAPVMRLEDMARALHARPPAPKERETRTPETVAALKTAKAAKLARRVRKLKLPVVESPPENAMIVTPDDGYGGRS